MTVFDLDRERERRENVYYGACPHCRGTDGYVNVGSDYWFVCDQHMTRWCAGAAVFSDHLDETPEEQAANVEKLARYRVVQPVYPDPDSWPGGAA